jgi:predicted nuclease of predicted toxin-antitoxin system
LEVDINLYKRIQVHDQISVFGHANPKGGFGLKVLLDEMYTGMKEYLEALGWGIETVNTAGLQGAEDSKILEYAKKNDLLIVTQDEKMADIAELRNAQCVLVSKKMLAKLIDDELRKKF